MNERIVQAIWILAALTAAPASFARVSPFVGADSVVVASGETRDSDLYVSARAVDILGRLEGDLIGGAQRFVIDGEVAGDVMVFAQTITVAGRVEDSVRAFVQSASIRGTVDGNLLVCGATIDITETAHITGNVYAFGGVATIAGTIDGNLTFKGGEAIIKADIGRDADVEADAIVFGDDATIRGDFVYSSRKPIEADLDRIVAGTATLEEPSEWDDDEEDEDSRFTTWDAVSWVWHTLAALIVGWVAIALGRGAAERAVSPVGTDTMMGGLIGFGTFLVVPAAAVLAILLILSAPLGVIALMLFVVALYLAKMPVAVWLGRWLLAQAGAKGASPFVGLAVGVPILYFLFLIPFWIGTLLWLAVTWIGLGAIILSVHGFMRRRDAEPATAE